MLGRQLLLFLQAHCLQGDKVECTHLPWSSYSHQPPHPPSSQREKAHTLGRGVEGLWAGSLGQRAKL